MVDENEMIECACGCGAIISKYGSNGRLRKRLYRHGRYGRFGAKLTQRQAQEENHKIPCQCGCGKTLMKYDDYGRSRKRINGHQRIGKKQTQESINKRILT